jgi:predicted DNA-binding protein
MKDRTDVTVPLPGEMNDRIEENLNYGDSKAEWIREAIEMRLESEAEGQGNASDARPACSD